MADCVYYSRNIVSFIAKKSETFSAGFTVVAALPMSVVNASAVMIAVEGSRGHKSWMGFKGGVSSVSQWGFEWLMDGKVGISDGEKSGKMSL